MILTEPSIQVCVLPPGRAMHSFYTLGAPDDKIILLRAALW